MTADILKLLKEKHVHYIDDPKVVDQIRNVCFPNGFGKLNGDVVGVDRADPGEAAGHRDPR